MTTTSSPSPDRPSLELLCIGNAIVDVLAPVDDAVLADIGSQRGAMTLIDADAATSIEARVRSEEIMGGGSAANTAVTAARMGLSVGYLGKVADDKAGRHFADDLKALGLHFPSEALSATAGIPTARCIVLVTPDGQRTMHTYLGACVEFGPDDVIEDVVASAGILYMEGYLYDKPQAQAAFERAAQIAHANGRKVALSLSDAFCVNRHRAAFRALVAGHVDILFANEDEILALYQTDSFAAAAAAVAAETELAALTRGALGCVVVSKGETVAVLTESAVVIDSTGAGDAFAAGFLSAIVRGADPQRAGLLGNQAAKAVIGRLGARPGPDFVLRA